VKPLKERPIIYWVLYEIFEIREKNTNHWWFENR